MRFLWISCLLIGSISCLPQGGYTPMFQYPGQAPSYEKPSAQSSGYSSPQGYYSAGTNTAGGSSDSTPPMWYTASYPEQEPAKPTYQRPAQSSGQGSYSGGDSSYSGSGSQQSGSQGAQSGAPGGQYQVEQESFSSSDDDDEEPEFTPVSDEDQVYAFKSRSRYNQKRLLFSQFRYTPTEPRVPQEPVFPYPSKSSHQGKGSMKRGR
ncbi:protein SSXT isoform X3 [Oryzias melastigma]|uniref:protein SSXT isoform X2 n=1 Tax=Oryzias melastigma TaxID=30732 RepID=UPI000CF7B421|nr:protein SSXT isoform X2 [Oryzias melastigma]XP_024136795.1 protein SSXT isoform X3 [Oryzias melastigma]